MCRPTHGIPGATEIRSAPSRLTIAAGGKGFGSPWLWISGPLIVITGTLILFGGNHPSGALHSVQAIGTIPEFLWELSLGLYCTFKGFRSSSPILRADAREDRAAAVPAVAPA